MASSGLSAEQHRPVPFYRNVKVLAVLAQIAFLVLIILLFWILYSNMIRGLRIANIPLDFGFLDDTAGFAIGETSIAYQPADTYARAFAVGVVNTLRVAGLGIILATILGTIVGIGRLSNNWLLRNVAAAYVAIFRNTPLLVQLIFWYIAVIRRLPRVRNAWGINGVILASNRGLAVAWPAAAESYRTWEPWLWMGLVIGVLAFVARRWQLARMDRPGSALPHAFLAAGLTVLIGALIVFATTGTLPLTIGQPVLGGFNFTGGAVLSPEFFALLLGLTIYTAAFIAEVVRGGIQSVNKGQVEAARALGLSPSQTLRLVIFPQALRVIIPPMTNQYLNLTKNSSLGVAVAFPDMFNVSSTIINQSGRSVQMFALIMASYLSVSLLTSLLMNLYNSRIRLVER